MTSVNQGALTADRRALLAQLMAEAGLATGSSDAILRRDERATAPLSYAQEVLWLLERATPPNAAYNTPLVRRLRGALDVPALVGAVGDVVARHEALRTRFRAGGDSGVQVVGDVPPNALTVVSVSDASRTDREAAALERVREVAATPFDLAVEAPFRALLVEIARDDHLLLLLTHHIASDAWSYGIILDDLSRAYAARRAGAEGTASPTDADTALQFGDFASWQRTTLRGELLESRLRYWREQLADLEPLALPLDFDAGLSPDSRGGRVHRVLDAAFANRLHALAERNGATLYMVLLAAFQIVLHRYSGQDDIVVGSAVAGRVRRETESMVGYFSQALPLRTRLEGDPTFAALLGRVADTVLGAFEHQDVPVETLALELRRDGGAPAPLFRVVLTMQDALATELRLDGVAVTPLEIDTGATKFDLTLLVTEVEGALELSLAYRTACFEERTAVRLLEHLEGVLDAAVADPSRRVSTIDLCTPADRAVLRARERPVVSMGSAASMTSLLAASVRRDPDAIAVRDDRVTLTAGELWRASGVLARELRAAGAGRRVALDLDRSVDAIVALVAIWRAGAAYVPMAPDWPESRRSAVLAESGAQIVVTAPERASAFPPSVATIVVPDVPSLLEVAAPDDAGADVRPEDLAYVLFTSGSTGAPKGVEVTHANAVHYTRAVSRVLADLAPDREGDGLETLRGARFAFASSLTADLGNTTVFLALCAGGVLEVLDRAATTEAAAFASQLTRRPADVMKLTPNHLAALLGDARGDELTRALPRRWLLLGGEPLPTALARRVLGAGTCRLVNHYGPTETTVGACTQEVSPELLAHLDGRRSATVPIGTPLTNVRAYVVDRAGNEQPPGIPGELVLAGDGVALGYVGRPDLTRDRFVTGFVRGHAGERVYRTGDRVRWRENESIEFLGREDDQVKLRGFRVELGEIEAVLCRHPDVERAIVGVRVAESAEPELVAWLHLRTVANHSARERTTPTMLREWAASELPDYMVPRRLLVLDAFPLRPNGKIDRRALQELVGAADAPSAGRAPEGPVETAIAGIWAEVLRRDDISATDNFLQLGGQSLLAIRVLGKLSRTFGVRLPLRTLFESPTIEQLAVALQTVMHGADTP